MLGQFKTCVIIPALNEADSIAKVLRDIPRWIDEVIVVDNGSTDATAGIARSMGATVIMEDRKGYGSACLAVMRAAGNAEYIGFIDADYSDYPSDLELLFLPLIKGECDLAIGSRNEHWKRAVPWHQRWGNWIACRAINLFHGSCFQDLGPMRCVSRTVLEALEMSDPDYGWTSEMQIKAVQQGFPWALGKS